eukprot:1159551-Pelagomonas_calceolata.AAC.10
MATVAHSHAEHIAYNSLPHPHVRLYRYSGRPCVPMCVGTHACCGSDVFATLEAGRRWSYSRHAWASEAASHGFL